VLVSPASDPHKQSTGFYCCFTVHFDKFKTSLPTNAFFIKRKMLQLTLKVSLYMGSYMFWSIQTIIREHMPDLAKVTVFVELLVKIHR
jgi:hypothetical protein